LERRVPGLLLLDRFVPLGTREPAVEPPERRRARRPFLPELVRLGHQPESAGTPRPRSAVRMIAPVQAAENRLARSRLTQ
jgi:hypothetical protein